MVQTMYARLSQKPRGELSVKESAKNKKYATAQTTTTKRVKLNKDNGLQTRWTRMPAGNSGLA
jgi:hypothetical protein